MIRSGSVPASAQVTHLVPTHPAFGAVGNGIADDTLALQAWADEITGSGSPLTTARAPKVTAHLPAGTYRITSPLVFRSVIGLRLICDRNAVILCDAPMQAPVIFDGLARSLIDGLSINGTANAVCDYGFLLAWTVAAARSTTKNEIHGCRVENLKCKTAFATEPFRTVQADAITYYNCIASGLIAGDVGYDAAYYLHAFKSGSGGSGNAYNIYYEGCTAARWGVGCDVGGSGGGWSGGEILRCGSMFGSSFPFGAFKAGGGWRAEGNGRIWNAPGATTLPSVIDIGEGWFSTDQMALDGRVVDNGGAGIIHIHDILIRGVQPAGASDPTIRVSDGGISRVARISAPTPVDSFITTTGGTSAVVHFSDYVQITYPGVQVSRHPGRIHVPQLKSTVADRAEFKDSVTGELLRKQGTSSRLLSGPRLNNGQTGTIVPTSRGWTRTPMALVAARLHCTRFVLDEDMTVASLGFVVTVAAGANDNVDLVVFDKTAAGSGIVRVRTGLVAAALNSVGPKTVPAITPVAFELLAGKVYYVGLLCPSTGAAAASILSADLGHPDAAVLQGSAAPQAEKLQKDGLADTSLLSGAGFSAGVGQVSPMFWLIP